MDTKSKSPASGKEKKTRRRLRLSCVECTKRRQKCDRTYPCSLCVSRGVSHLCRWETVPLARPTPARPPNPAILAQDHDATVAGLIARIAHLEKALEEKKVAEMKIETMSDIFVDSPCGSSTLASTASTSPDPEAAQYCGERSPELPEEDELEPALVPLCLLEQGTYSTTSSLAQLCLGHHGEYIGRGSLICALHCISTGKKARFLYAKSTDVISPYRDTVQGFTPDLIAGRIEDLIRNIPPMSVTAALAQAFFNDNNWRFGIPEKWFHEACAQMWTALGYPGPHGQQINPNWLSLLFAVLASAPAMGAFPDTTARDRNIESSDAFFICAMTARRIAEDDHLNKPSLSLMVSAADGTVLSCLAVPLLCSYLSERGRISEAWKLVGSGLRNAEAVGMHRDPEWKKWQVMSTDEILLRRRAWWGLVIWDKMYSYLLGRPHMVRREIFDVALPSPVNTDGTRNRFNLGQIIFIQLANLVGETLEKCFSVEYPNCPAFLEMDEKLQQWEGHLPPEYRQFQEETVTKDIDPVDWMMISHQRYTLNTWYLIIRTKLHLASFTGFQRPQQASACVRESRKTCILLSMRLIRLQCEMHESATIYKADHGGQESIFPGSNWYFEGCFSLFEATIALLTTLTRYPWKEKIIEAEELIDRAMVVFARVVRDEQGKRGEIARMAAEVLQTLRREHWWRAQTTAAAGSTVQSPQAFPPSIFLPGAIEDSKFLSNGYDWSSMAPHPNIFGLTPHNVSAIRGISIHRQSFLDYSSIHGAQEVHHGTDIYMADMLHENSR
ncbi:hypothetical protein BDZ94DRAFT_726218 [Collybia nuda]|uniref:Zn(2)-C6 fungal-type domain-containing protein n=1 Tax=Collybia nuda TaxID=64659 RepID=A0A9P5Y541_9AGAR|nr:hypothetical protein BDZ94DRAFT_726218 [Collybia nuda]